MRLKTLTLEVIGRGAMFGLQKWRIYHRIRRGVKMDTMPLRALLTRSTFITPHYSG